MTRQIIFAIRSKFKRNASVVVSVAASADKAGLFPHISVRILGTAIIFTFRFIGPLARSFLSIIPLLIAIR